jgi:hypothetical protein
MDDVIERTEILLPEPARALGALLGVGLPDLEHGAGLPLLWHWVKKHHPRQRVLFLPATAGLRLGPPAYAGRSRR